MRSPIKVYAKFTSYITLYREVYPQLIADVNELAVIKQIAKLETVNF